MRHGFNPGSLILGVALLLGGVSASSAQGLPAGASSLSEKHGDWTVACVMPDSNARCAISQRQVNRADYDHPTTD